MLKMDATKNASITGDNSGSAQPARHMPKVLLRVFCAIVGLCVVGGIAFWLHHVYLHTYVYIDRHTEIYCVDSVTGAPVEVDVDLYSIKYGGLDDDPDRTWSIGPEDGGRIRADRNVWVSFEATAPGYQTGQIKLDEHSPETMTLKMMRAATTK